MQCPAIRPPPFKRSSTCRSPHPFNSAFNSCFDEQTNRRQIVHQSELRHRLERVQRREGARVGPALRHHLRPVEELVRPAGQPHFPPGRRYERNVRVNGHVVTFHCPRFSRSGTIAARAVRDEVQHRRRVHLAFGPVQRRR